MALSRYRRDAEHFEVVTPFSWNDRHFSEGEAFPAHELGLGEMERRMAALGFTWAATTAVQAYTVHDIHPFLAEELVARGAARHVGGRHGPHSTASRAAPLSVPRQARIRA